MAVSKHSTARLRRDGVVIFRAGLAAANPVEAILRHVQLKGSRLIAGKRRYDLTRVRNIYVVGAGKAGAGMGMAVERLLGSRITAGCINVKDGHTAKLRRIRLNECGHPLPDERGVAGAQEIGNLAAKAGAGDLVICLLSGGGSALLPFPARPITLAEKQKTTQLLLDCGATIHEINAVRKHLSSIKGGRLAALAYPADVLSLILSDVIGDDLDVIASGPTAPDASTFQTALDVLEKYEIARSVPGGVLERLRDGAGGRLPETPKAGALPFRHTQNLIIGSNQLALDAAAKKAKDLGYKPLVLSSFVQGETREAASFHAAIAKEIQVAGRPVKPPCCIISGGETTVTIKGKGKGGRNQEFALAAAIAIEGAPGTVILSAGTDGTDGPTDAAGAIVDGKTVSEAGLNAQAFLDDNDAYTFFNHTGDLLKTGPTGTNVMDIRLMLFQKGTTSRD